MQIPVWLKPSLLGAVVGAGAITFIGFSWGGWVSGNNANAMAENRSEEAVTLALTPICLFQSSEDPNIETVISSMKAARAYQRSEFIMEAGWATMPGQDEPNAQIARACVKEFASRF